MIDRYIPTLDTFTLTDEEKSAISSALETPHPWDWDPGGEQSEAIKEVKKKILTYHLQRHKNLCCYCRANLYGGGPFVTDREHILPKSVDSYRPYSYSMWNLGIACKRCNIEYKKNKTNFVVNLQDVDRAKDSANYRFIHPNFDSYGEHISRVAIQINDAVLVKYTVVLDSAKGAYTYQYFNLHGLEVDSFDKAQGLGSPQQLGDAALQARALANEFGQ